MICRAYLGQKVQGIKTINPQRVSSPDNITGHAFRICSSELADVHYHYTTCYKKHRDLLEYYHSFALTPTVMNIDTFLDTLDPLQFVYH